MNITIGKILLEAVDIKRDKEADAYVAYLVMTTQKLQELLTFKQTFLHPNEQRYYDSLIAEKRQLSYLLGRYVAKEGIAAYLDEQDLCGIEVKPGVFQQPVICYSRSHGTQVSIAHSKHWGAALVFPEVHPMAIDVEEISEERNLASILSLTAQENVLANNLTLHENEKLTLFWTIKEAISKVLKTGLMTDFRVFEVKKIREHNGYFESYFANFAQYKTISWLFKGFIWSIILPKKSYFPISRVC